MPTDTALISTVKTILSDEITEEVNFMFADLHEANWRLQNIQIPAGAPYAFVWIPALTQMNVRTVQSRKSYLDYPSSFMILGRIEQQQAIEQKDDVEDLVNSCFDLGVKFYKKLEQKSAIIEPGKIISPIKAQRLYRESDENLYGHLFMADVPIVLSAIGC